MQSPALYLKEEAKQRLDAGFLAAFGKLPSRYFSAPGRTEIGGNHTDHQRGRVLAAAVNLDTLAAVAPNALGQIRILSQGYPMCCIELSHLEVVVSERNTTAALVRGVAARFRQLGYPVEGFDAYCTSTVLPGSGLSSSAAFEVLMGTVINGLFCQGGVSAPQIAMIGQYAENVYFGKPCGLMDQTASAVGGLVAIDFAQAENPQIRSVPFDLAGCGYALCILDSGADHADLTDEYAAVPAEMKAVAAQLGAEVLSQVSEQAFFRALPRLRESCGDRAVLRSLHFLRENQRVVEQVQALEKGDFERFLQLVGCSGRSSWMYLQNVIPAGNRSQQAMAVTLALCEELLQGQGAFRVHGGGFAGTVQAFVPMDLLDGFCRGAEAVLGAGACHVLSVRPQGGTELQVP